MMFQTIIKRNVLAYQLLGGAPITALHRASGLDSDVFLRELDAMIREGAVIRTKENRFLPPKAKNDKKKHQVSIRLTDWQHERLKVRAEFNHTSLQEQISVILDMSLADVQ